MPTDLKPLSILVRVVKDSVGQYKLRASVVTEGEEDSYRGVNYSPDWHDNGGEFYGLTIGAYIDYVGFSSSGNEWRGIWGCDVFYDNVRIRSAAQAQAIAKVMTAIAKGQSKAEATDGYLQDSEFARFVFRIAAALKIKNVQIYRTKRHADIYGTRFSKVTATDLQSFQHHITDDVRAGKGDDWL